jgi:hypothetical protein
MSLTLCSLVTWQVVRAVRNSSGDPGYLMVRELQMAEVHRAVRKQVRFLHRSEKTERHSSWLHLVSSIFRLGTHHEYGLFVYLAETVAAASLLAAHVRRLHADDAVDRDVSHAHHRLQCGTSHFSMR